MSEFTKQIDPGGVITESDTQWFQMHYPGYDGPIRDLTPAGYTCHLKYLWPTLSRRARGYRPDGGVSSPISLLGIADRYHRAMISATMNTPLLSVKDLDLTQVISWDGYEEIMDLFTVSSQIGSLLEQVLEKRRSDGLSEEDKIRTFRSREWLCKYKCSSDVVVISSLARGDKGTLSTLTYVAMLRVKFIIFISTCLYYVLNGQASVANYLLQVMRVYLNDPVLGMDMVSKIEDVCKGIILSRGRVPFLHLIESIRKEEVGRNMELDLNLLCNADLLAIKSCSKCFPHPVLQLEPIMEKMMSRMCMPSTMSGTPIKVLRLFKRRLIDYHYAKTGIAIMSRTHIEEYDHMVQGGVVNASKLSDNCIDKFMPDHTYPLPSMRELCQKMNDKSIAPPLNGIGFSFSQKLHQAFYGSPISRRYRARKSDTSLVGQIMKNGLRPIEEIVSKAMTEHFSGNSIVCYAMKEGDYSAKKAKAFGIYTYEMRFLNTLLGLLVDTHLHDLSEDNCMGDSTVDVYELLRRKSSTMVDGRCGFVSLDVKGWCAYQDPGLYVQLNEILDSLFGLPEGAFSYPYTHAKHSTHVFKVPSCPPDLSVESEGKESFLITRRARRLPEGTLQKIWQLMYDLLIQIALDRFKEVCEWKAMTVGDNKVLFITLHPWTSCNLRSLLEEILQEIKAVLLSVGQELKLEESYFTTTYVEFIKNVIHEGRPIGKTARAFNGLVDKERSILPVPLCSIRSIAAGVKNSIIGLDNVHLTLKMALYILLNEYCTKYSLCDEISVATLAILPKCLTGSLGLWVADLGVNGYVELSSIAREYVGRLISCGYINTTYGSSVVRIPQRGLQLHVFCHADEIMDYLKDWLMDTMNDNLASTLSMELSKGELEVERLDRIQAPEYSYEYTLAYHAQKLLSKMAMSKAIPKILKQEGQTEALRKVNEFIVACSRAELSLLVTQKTCKLNPIIPIASPLDNITHTGPGASLALRKREIGSQRTMMLYSMMRRGGIRFKVYGESVFYSQDKFVKFRKAFNATYGDVFFDNKEGLLIEQDKDYEQFSINCPIEIMDKYMFSTNTIEDLQSDEKVNFNVLGYAATLFMLTNDAMKGAAQSSHLRLVLPKSRNASLLELSPSEKQCRLLSIILACVQTGEELPTRLAKLYFSGIPVFVDQLPGNLPSNKEVRLELEISTRYSNIGRLFICNEKKPRSIKVCLQRLHASLSTISSSFDNSSGKIPPMLVTASGFKPSWVQFIPHARSPLRDQEPANLLEYKEFAAWRSAALPRWPATQRDREAHKLTLEQFSCRKCIFIPYRMSLMRAIYVTRCCLYKKSFRSCINYGIISDLLENRPNDLFYAFSDEIMSVVKPCNPPCIWCMQAYCCSLIA